jgi:hypothetical protein
MHVANIHDGHYFDATRPKRYASIPTAKTCIGNVLSCQYMYIPLSGIGRLHAPPSTVHSTSRHNRQRGQPSRKRVHGALAVVTMVLRRCRTAAMTVSWSTDGMSCEAVRSREHVPSGGIRVQCLRARTLYERVCDVAAGSYDDLALAHIYDCCVSLVFGVSQLLIWCNLLGLI